jgi:hypothetical protein
MISSPTKMIDLGPLCVPGPERGDSGCSSFRSGTGLRSLYFPLWLRCVFTVKLAAAVDERALTFDNLHSVSGWISKAAAARPVRAL